MLKQLKCILAELYTFSVLMEIIKNSFNQLLQILFDCFIILKISIATKFSLIDSQSLHTHA